MRESDQIEGHIRREHMATLLREKFRCAVFLATLMTPSFSYGQSPNLSADAKQFVVYQPAKIESFVEYPADPKPGFYLHYSNMIRGGVGQLGPWYAIVVQVSRVPSVEIAMQLCNDSFNQAGRNLKNRKRIGEYACAFIDESTDDTGTTLYRSHHYVKCLYSVSIGETVQKMAMPAQPPAGPLLAVLDAAAAQLPPGDCSEQPLTAAEVAFRNALFPALGLAGDTARSCLDEVMNWAEAQTDNTTRDQIAQLRKAATAARTVEVLAAVTARPEDFDSQWWDALREVVPNPATPNDPRGTATDFLIDLLPPPYNTLINVGRNTHKGLLAAKNHITDPKVRGEIYACYRRERGGHSPSTGGSAGAYESGLSHILLDATAACPAAETFKSSYENEMRGLSGQERDNAFRRLITPVAIRFEFIYRVEDARANRAARVADAWKPAQNVLEKLKTRVNACIAKPR